MKTSGESDQVYVNSEFVGGRTNTSKFSLYVSPYLVANQGGRYTKHIYIGSQRIASKIGDFDSYGSDPRRIEYAGSETDGISVDYRQKYSTQQLVIKENYATFDVPYNGTDNNDYADGDGKIRVRYVDTGLYTAWKDGFFSFDDITLGETMRRIADWYDVNVVFDRPELTRLRLRYYNERNVPLADNISTLNSFGTFRVELKGRTLHVR